jgi:hypothetical protein
MTYELVNRALVARLSAISNKEKREKNASLSEQMVGVIRSSGEAAEENIGRAQGRISRDGGISSE